jgi:DNA-binding PadR family transcriptional regulator
MSPVFGHGALRLYLLHLLDEEPRHGYDIIRALEDRFMGMYTPSAGTIYPRLSALEDDGLVTHDVIGGKKVYRLTEAGRTELQARRDEIDAVVKDAVQSARALAREIRDDVRAGVRDLRRELRDAVKDVRREERRVGRDIARVARDTVRAEWVDPGVARNGSAQDRAEIKDVLRSLRSDLESFVTDVIAAARRHRLDADRVRLVREALLDAREAVIEALDGRAETSTPRRASGDER